MTTNWTPFLINYAIAAVFYTIGRLCFYTAFQPYRNPQDIAVDTFGMLVVFLVCLYLHRRRIKNGGKVFASKTTAVQQLITCPVCDTVQKAAVVFDSSKPFPIYAHECVVCGYWVTESEWNEVAI